ncbi:putative ABC transport system permease protein [Lipingzhangella halophila]|uniref:Putative ABC transport system permease protein n=2 Tax=Lipingzhangella halophila TaxID=1783352 RepID=A0A7W7W3K0_9ACTN|nr:putative ABC transport system permease protein [Lipingzhangella halophila]
MSTMMFSAMLVGALGLMTETGVRGQVSTGEYAAAPVLVGAQQTRPVRDDVDIAVPDRALMPASILDEVSEALPDAEVVADRIAPAVLVVGNEDPVPVDAHPWSATALGDRGLASGRAPEAEDEVVLSAGVDGSEQLDLGHVVDVGFGGEAESFTVVGTVAADDSGNDVADVYLSDGHERLQDAAGQRVVAVGVWPAESDDTEVLDAVAAHNEARLWPADARGDIEVVRQGPAKATLVSAAAAFGALGIIVSVFTLIVITSLQIRERSRELAMLRVIGATPRQVKRLLCGEARRIAIAAATVGSLAGSFLGARLIGLLQSWGAIPQSLEPVYGPAPFMAAFAVVVVSAEVAARVSLRRVHRESPLAGLEGADERRARLPRMLAGLAGVVLGLAMACAPMYASGEAAVGLPGLAGLVIAISVGPLSPSIVRLLARTQRRRGGRSAPRYIAVAGLTARSARVGGALTPIVLGVSLSATQLFTAVTESAIATDQVEAGQHADFLVTAPLTGVDDDVADAVTAMPDVASTEPIVTTSVLIRGTQHDASWQSSPALAVEGDRIGQYADLRPVGSDTVAFADGGVALSTQAASSLGAEEGDDIDLVLPDGRAIERRVTGVYLRGLGFGDVVLPSDDLKPAMASGQPTALAVSASDSAPVAGVERQVGEHLARHPGVATSDSATAGETDEATADVAFSVLLLLILWGYIAITVVNSLVITTLARRAEFTCLRIVGATPAQQRRTVRWEAGFLAATACLVATAASIPGLCGLTFALSNGERMLPAIDITAYAVIVTTSFGLVMAVTELAARKAMRTQA